MEDEYPDYDLQMQYQDYLKYGVDVHEVHNAISKDGSKVCAAEIRSEVLSQVSDLFYGLKSSTPTYKYYCTTRKLLNPRRSLIQSLDLGEHEGLILILLSLAPWGAKTSKPSSYSLKTKDPATIKAEIDEMCKLLDLIHLCDDYYQDPSGASPKWSFISGQVKFRATGGSEADLRLPSVEPDSLKHILLDYLQLVRSKGETIHDRMKLVSERSKLQFNVSNRSSAWQSHYIFLYNFVSFLENKTPHSTRNGNSRTDQLRIYLVLLEEAGYEIASTYRLTGEAKKQSNIKVLERWHKRGEGLVSDYQRNNL